VNRQLPKFCPSPAEIIYFGSFSGNWRVEIMTFMSRNYSNGPILLRWRIPPLSQFSAGPDKVILPLNTLKRSKSISVLIVQRAKLLLCSGSFIARIVDRSGICLATVPLLRWEAGQNRIVKLSLCS
jgi:hypothetical protein